MMSRVYKWKQVKKEILNSILFTLIIGFVASIYVHFYKSIKYYDSWGYEKSLY